MTNLQIRPLQKSDAADWEKLWRAYLEFYQTELPETAFKTTLSRLLGNDPQDFNCLIAVDQEKTIGLVHHLSHRHCWREENVVYLQDLFVHASQRGKGVGRSLVQAVYDISNKNGTPNVYWLTHESNKDAQKLYDRIAVKTGFIKYQR